VAEVIVSQSAVLDAAPEVVHTIFADYHVAHPSVLPRPHFGKLVVERGGTGAGTRFTVETRQGLGMRTYRMDVSEPRPGVIVETDVDSDLATTFTVEPAEGGRTRVTITTRWTRGGVRGWIEQKLFPRLAAPIYQQELRNVERLARERSATPAPA
jgi:Polyketide cyclase / dehydrase and lipid transport